MRAILFRGKRSDVVNGNWVYGFYAYIPCGKFSKNEHLIQTIKNNGQIGRLYEVIPETVGEFTGLLDKNGKRIYEGDIVKTHYANVRSDKQNRIEQVAFHNGRFCAFLENFGCKIWSNIYDGTPHLPQDKSVYMDSIEVVGNIHDSPELLKE